MKTNIFLFFLLILLFSCNTKKQITTNAAINSNPVINSTSEERLSPGKNNAFTKLEVMPSIASCGENDKYNKAGSCTNKKLASFIYKNLQYPEIGKKSKITGIVAVKFFVNPDGSISDIGIKCNKISGTEAERKAFADEAVRVIKEMKKSDIKWNAGNQGGTKARGLYYYPIVFRYK